MEFWKGRRGGIRRSRLCCRDMGKIDYLVDVEDGQAMLVIVLAHENTDEYISVPLRRCPSCGQRIVVAQNF